MQSEQSKPKTQISEPHLFSAQETAPEMESLMELEHDALATVLKNLTRSRQQHEVLAGGSSKAGQRLWVTMGVALTMVGAVVYSGMSLTRAEDREPNGEDRGVTAHWKAEKMQTVAPDPADQIQAEAQVQTATFALTTVETSLGFAQEAAQASLLDYPASPILALQTRVDNSQDTRMEGHQGIVKSVQFSPQGDRVVTSGEDGTARLWDLQGRELTKFEGHQGSVYDVQFSPQGDRIVTRGYDGTARLWDLQGRELTKFEGHQGSVSDVQFSPQGDRIVTGGSDGTVRLWDLQGQELTKFEGHQGIVWSVQFSPQGDRIVTGGYDGTARLWDLQGQELTKFEGHQGRVMSVQFSPQGDRILTRGSDGTARLWDLQGRELTKF